MPRTANISGRSRRLSLVAQAPEHHEGDDIGRVLGPVQQGVGALVELLATCTAAEPAIALGGALRALRDGFRPTFHTPHPRPPPAKRGGPIPDQVPSAKGSGASPDRTPPT